MKSRQAGNAIIIILIAVFLFGALAAVFMRGAKTGHGNLTSQQAKLAAQEIIDYAQALERTISKLRQNGCSENELSYYDASITKASLYAAAPPPNECNIFHAGGGKMTSPQFYKRGFLDTTLPWWNDYIGGDLVYMVVDGIGRTAGDNASKDTVFWVRGVKKEICDALNTQLSVAPNMTTVRLSNIRMYYYPNTFNLSTATALAGDLKGKTAACYLYNNTPMEYDFFYVVIAR